MSVKRRIIWGGLCVGVSWGLWNHFSSDSKDREIISTNKDGGTYKIVIVSRERANEIANENFNRKAKDINAKLKEKGNMKD